MPSLISSSVSEGSSDENRGKWSIWRKLRIFRVLGRVLTDHRHPSGRNGATRRSPSLSYPYWGACLLYKLKKDTVLQIEYFTLYKSVLRLRCLAYIGLSPNSLSHMRREFKYPWLDLNLQRRVFMEIAQQRELLNKFIASG